MIASSSSVWAWLAAAADTDAGALTAATAAHPAVRIAVGPAGTGVDGFRRSHFDAVATQRLMSRRPDLRVARFADVQLVTLALQDEQRAREFVARTLGTLAGADRELRDTLCVYIGEQFSAARAARALYTHRNTVLNRLQRGPPPRRRCLIFWGCCPVVITTVLLVLYCVLPLDRPWNAQHSGASANSAPRSSQAPRWQVATGPASIRGAGLDRSAVVAARLPGRWACPQGVATVG